MAARRHPWRGLHLLTGTPEQSAVWRHEDRRAPYSGSTCPQIVASPASLSAPEGTLVLAGNTMVDWLTHSHQDRGRRGKGNRFSSARVHEQLHDFPRGGLDLVVAQLRTPLAHLAATRAYHLLRTILRDKCRSLAIASITFPDAGSRRILNTVSNINIRISPPDAPPSEQAGSQR
jgi:hypothetical protein